MRILYAALDQTVPGTTGGSVHVRAVAEGLAALGDEVHVLTQPGAGGFPEGAVRWHAMGPPLGRRELRLTRAGRVTAAAREIGPDVVLERYYNFGGEGLVAARALGVPAVLEVNAPIVDHAGSLKSRLDRATVVQPMRRWRDWQCRHADLILTPSRPIVPDWVAEDRVVQIEWGADTTRFTPGAAGRVPYDRAPGEIVAVFAGAFRAWHGAVHLVEAIKTLHARGRTEYRAVLIGDGPERAAVEAAARGAHGILLTGALPHDSMPAALAAADIGVGPFDVARHAALSIDFYWSPLKIFEYMACGLPVVAPRIPRTTGLVADGVEGVLYDAARPDALADALETLGASEVRERLGRAARERAVRDFSWQAHCLRLRGLLEKLVRVARFDLA
jgi:glycosyltransferase involved in cell wall biosynthesis